MPPAMTVIRVPIQMCEIHFQLGPAAGVQIHKSRYCKGKEVKAMFQDHITLNWLEKCVLSMTDFRKSIFPVV